MSKRPGLVLKMLRKIYVSFPTFQRAEAAIRRLTAQGRRAEYDGQTGARYWIKINYNSRNT